MRWQNFLKKAFTLSYDDVWYATNGEIYDYVQAYNRLIWSVEMTFVHNPSAIDVYLDFKGKEVVVKAGKPRLLAIVHDKTTI